jgi:glycosyltransferase involved in cell wall biosynthesis
MTEAMLDRITPVILTFDEAPNIGRVLDRLTWARDIVVVDSNSTDGTQAICAQHPNVRLFTRPFDNHADQWNFAIAETEIRADWILALDADFILTEAVVAELAALAPPDSVAGYWLSFRYAMMGKVLRSGVYPPLLALYRRSQGRYVQDGHTQRAVVEGETRRLTSPALHDDRKPLSRWLRSQGNYAQLEADKLAARPAGLKAWLRARTPFAPLAMGLYCLIWRGGLFEGPAGWAYALQRMIAEGMISAAVLDRRLRR